MGIILLTCLGARTKDVSAHQTTRYRFDDGTVVGPCQHCGIAVTKYAKHKAQRLDRVVVLGTAESAWEVMEASGKTENSSLLQKSLESNGEKVRGIIADRFKAQLGVPCKLITVPTELTLQSLSRIFDILREETQAASSVWLDVTHGLRGLSIMMAYSIVALAHKYDFGVPHIFYGAFELAPPTQPGQFRETPVVRLDLAQTLPELSYAERVAEKTFDFTPLVPYLGDLGNAKQHLLNVAFQLSLGNAKDGRAFLDSALGENHFVTEALVASKVLPDLLKHLSTTVLSDNYATQVDGWLEQNDLLRAVRALYLGAKERRTVKGESVGVPEQVENLARHLLLGEEPSAHTRFMIQDSHRFRNSLRELAATLLT